MSSSIQAVNPRFSGGVKDVEDPTRSTMPYDAPKTISNKSRAIGLVTIAGIVIAACAYLLLIPGDSAAVVASSVPTAVPAVPSNTTSPTTVAPTAPTLEPSAAPSAAPTAAPTANPTTAAPTAPTTAPTLEPSAAPTTAAPTAAEVAITFAPDAEKTSVSAPYRAENEVNVFDVDAAGRYVTVEFASFNLENGFDTLELWNMVDVNVAGKLPIKVLTGNNTGLGELTTTTEMGGMTLKVITDDDIVPAGGNAGFVASLKFVDSMAPTAAPTNTPVPELESIAFVAEEVTFTDDGKPFAAAPYGNYMLKEWNFTATVGEYAAMHFTEFDVRSYPENRDFVEIFDGESGERLAYFNGETYTYQRIKSKSMKLRIRFTVGGRGGYDGFEAKCYGHSDPTGAPTGSGNATAAPTAPVAEIPTTVLALGDEFTHNGADKALVIIGKASYVDNYAQAWSIDAGEGNHAVVHFEYFDTETGYDYLTVTNQETGDELLKVAGRFTGGFRLPLPAQKVVLTFVSDGGVVATGFVGKADSEAASRCEFMFATPADANTQMKTKPLAGQYLGVISNELASFNAVVGIIGESSASNKYAFPQGMATITTDQVAGTVTFATTLPAAVAGAEYEYTITETGLAATTDEVFMIDGLHSMYGNLYTRAQAAQVTAPINVIKAGQVVKACADAECQVTPSLVAYARVCTNIAKPEEAGGAVVPLAAAETFEITTDEPFIKIVYSNPTTKKVVRDAFDAAAAKWNKLITNNFPDIPLPASITSGADLGCDAKVTTKPLPDTTMLKGLVIYATIAEIDGPGRILGSAGPCAFSLESGFFFGQGSNVQPRVGSMNFDVEDLGGMYQDGSLNGVIAHEMGHVIGIGTTWRAQYYKTLDLTRAQITPQSDPRYIKENGIAGWVAIGGTDKNNTIGGEMKVGVPAARTGGGGTAGGHWRETQFGSEMMSGYSAPGDKDELSLMTAMSLKDIGYTNLDLNATDYYEMPKEFQVQEFLANARPLGNDIIDFKRVGVLSANGDVSIQDGQ